MVLGLIGRVRGSGDCGLEHAGAGRAEEFRGGFKGEEIAGEPTWRVKEEIDDLCKRELNAVRTFYHPLSASLLKGGGDIYLASALASVNVHGVR